MVVKYLLKESNLSEALKRFLDVIEGFSFEVNHSSGVFGVFVISSEFEGSICLFAIEAVVMK